MPDSKLPGTLVLGKGGCTVRKMTFRQIARCVKSGLFEIPGKIQTELEEDKVDAIVRSFNECSKSSNYLLHHGYAVSLCHLQGTHCYYVVDGQHRLRAIERLYRDSGASQRVLVRVLECGTVQKMQRDFDLNNIKTDIPDLYRSLRSPAFRQSMMDLKAFLKRNFGKAFNRNRTPKRSRRIHLDVFLGKFGRDACVDAYGRRLEDPLFLRGLVLGLNRSVHEQLRGEQLRCFVNKADERCITDHISDGGPGGDDVAIPFYLSLDNVGEWTVPIGDAGPPHIRRIKYTHAGIPKSVRSHLLSRDFGDGIEAPCPICSRTMRRGDSSVHCGHVVSARNGGGVALENLRAICQECNLSMGTMDMAEFKRRHYPSPSSGPHPPKSGASAATADDAENKTPN